MDIDDQRDFAEENYNRAEMEREGMAEYCTKESCPSPVWVGGMCYIHELDVREVYDSIREQGRIECERCGGEYHPDFSADAYDL